MINFFKVDKQLILSYTPEQQPHWVEKALKEKGKIIFKRTFTFTLLHLFKLEDSDQKENEDLNLFEEFKPSYFVFANLENDYYKIVRGILIDNFNIYLHKEINPISAFFAADSNVSVFKLIDNISNQDIYIGGDKINAIPFGVFEKMLTYFPTAHERRKYVEARIASVIRNYLDNTKDAESTYQKYLNKKLHKKGINLNKTFQEFELIKYQKIYDKLTEMLNEEEQYSENQWQEEILQIILLLYPKYISVFKEVPIYAKITNDIKLKKIDFLLVDSNGNIDIVEIKKPFENSVMTQGYYRDNFIPLRELSGTVMQIEKYIYYLNRWSYEGEKFLSEKYKSRLPFGFEIKITNPNGIIIMGRENNLSVDQKRDFEVVKRKYKNVLDIITYDNLLERLGFMIEQIKKL